MATSLETLERLAASDIATQRAPARRMLVIVNPYATTVSDRLKHLVVYALQGRYEVEAVDTQARDHATELCREAAHEGYDVVVAFGGDGTVNEAANGLAGSDTPLTCLPGGSTNVYARMLGIPNDVVDATEHLLRMADDFKPRRVDLARVNDRAFTFSSGIGLDASVVARVDAHPRLKRRFGEWYFTSSALSVFTRKYLFKPPKLEVEVDGKPHTGVTTVIQNGDPFTYFNNRPIELAEEGDLANGSLGGVVLRRANPIDMPTVLWRAFSKTAKIAKHRQVDAFEGADEIVVRSADGRPVPMQVDGDYIGDVTEARYTVTPGGLLVVS